MERENAYLLQPPLRLPPRPAARRLRLALPAMLLAFVVVVLGAYVRLSDAGLGCPDWPGCYGRLAAPHDEEAQQVASAAYPGSTVDAPKAWKEMVHRYFAGTLGLAVAAIFARSLRQKPRPRVPTLLVAVIVTQALLGMWTVTWKLMPLVVTAHLLGGMLTLALLSWVALARPREATATATAVAAAARLRPAVGLGLAVLALQIALGGWVSSNAAGLACGELPRCLGEWVPAMDLAGGFDPGRAAAGSWAALVAIHWMHRLGALLTLATLLWLGLQLLATPLARLGALLLALVTMQVGIGIANVALHLPLPLAVLHNAGAAALVVALVAIAGRLRKGVQP